MPPMNRPLCLCSLCVEWSRLELGPLSGPLPFALVRVPPKLWWRPRKIEIDNRQPAIDDGDTAAGSPRSRSAQKFQVIHTPSASASLCVLAEPSHLR